MKILHLVRSTVLTVIVMTVIAPAAQAQGKGPLPHPHGGEATHPVALPTILVHKSGDCRCCIGWVKHLRGAGFAVEVRNRQDLNPIKDRLGVPPSKRACHTAEVAGYFIEGHVPAADIKRLLAEKPSARGLTVPGMPAGAPGMDAPGKSPPYAVELVARDGSTRTFARH